jgi:hypothetical protein
MVTKKRRVKKPFEISAGQTLSSADPAQDPALASNDEKPDSVE